ncbi:glycosyltransferase family 4 protein [Candidatus Cyanaurora vandensis]|uniref:glycosyltransferase family 4 protein n=1 Tax=Candidatus Cyanaurora vandensis TaxID=2714958 RepID=UPI00257C84C9|nr:glycosyltransferase family 4 protein [Candidatus Cyanaurora vandensis]
MRIAVIGSKGLPAKQGGVERHCEEIYGRMVAQGHEVDLYGRASYTQVRGYHRGIRVVPLPVPGLKGGDAFLSAALGTVVAQATHYDIIHIHALGPALFSGLPRLSRAGVVVTCHGLDWQRAKWGKISSTLLHWGERCAVQFAQQLIVVSEDLGAYFTQTYGRETVYIPNAPAGLSPSDPEFTYVQSLGLTPGRYILFMGRLVPEKRPDLLLQAFQRLSPPGWKLAFVGGVSDTGSYTAQLLDWAVGDPNVVFVGELQGERLAESLRGAGLFVLPSDVEGLPLALLEAMSELVPVVVSDIPVHRQLTQGGRGTCFKTGDLGGCADALAWVLAHPQVAQGMARTAQQHVQTHFNWDLITQQTLQVYSQLVESRTARIGVTS